MSRGAGTILSSRGRRRLGCAIGGVAGRAGGVQFGLGDSKSALSNSSLLLHQHRWLLASAAQITIVSVVLPGHFDFSDVFLNELVFRDGLAVLLAGFGILDRFMQAVFDHAKQPARR